MHEKVFDPAITQPDPETARVEKNLIGREKIWIERELHPLMQQLCGISPGFIGLAKNVLDGLHCGLGEAVTLGVIWDR